MNGAPESMVRVLIDQANASARHHETAAAGYRFLESAAREKGDIIAAEGWGAVALANEYTAQFNATQAAGYRRGLENIEKSGGG